MELNSTKENTLTKPTFFLSVLLWSFLNFSLLKLFFELYNNPVLLVTVYSLGCYLFWIYYYINSGKLLPLWEFLFSYVLVCVCVFSFHWIYDALFVVKPLHNYDSNLFIIFVVSAVPFVFLFYVGKAIFKAVKTE